MLSESKKTADRASIEVQLAERRAEEAERECGFALSAADKAKSAPSARFADWQAEEAERACARIELLSRKAREILAEVLECEEKQRILGRIAQARVFAASLAAEARENAASAAELETETERSEDR